MCHDKRMIIEAIVLVLEHGMGKTIYGSLLGFTSHVLSSIISSAVNSINEKLKGTNI